METIIIFISIIILVYLPNIKESIDESIDYFKKRFKKNNIMKKYKLIKEYPGSWEKNTIVNIASDNIHVLINGVCSPLNPQEIMDYPEYWQEIIEKDYKILSILGHMDMPIKCTDFVLEEGWQTFIRNNPKCKIHSVKRLSDGEIFTIGDKYNDCDLKNETIISFSISSCNGLLINSSLLKNIQRAKKPLFTTEDGVDIYDGDFYQLINPNIWNTYLYEASNHCDYNFKALRFSTKKAAEEYILMNKPCLSLNDVASIYPGIRKDHNTASHQAERLKELVKSKL